MVADPTPHLASGSPQAASRIVVMIFSDLVGSTALPAKFGAAAFNAALRMHNESFERLAEEEGVTVVKFTGDGYFAWCASAAGAVRFGLRFQQAMRDMEWGEVALATRLGIHLGEVSDITAAGRTDMIGSAANLASRIMSVGLGGQILLSRAPFDEGRLHVSAHPPARGGEVPTLEWLAHGPYRFNGYDEPIEIFEVGAKNLAPLSPPPDAEKARRALRPGDEETLGWRPAEGLEIPGRPGWRIAEKLGAGGFGEVWAGQQVKTRDRRAFKFCFDAERLRALKREVTLTRLLRETLGEREDIVRIFDLRLDAPPYFLESELATDGNLLQWAERQGGLGQIPLDARLELVAATAAAIGAAHSVGVLHKDIKPTNVLIFTGKDGRARPRLVDFGIGALSDSTVLAQHGITAAGFTGATLQHSSGTPTYSPPEYLAGRPFTVQGDVYSLGVMLWQLVTAKADQPLAEGWQRDVGDPLLREDIAACVDGDPTRRLPSAAELATRLRALSERRAEAARLIATEAADAQRRERLRRLRLTTAIATLVAIIAIPLALWAVVKQREAEREKANAQEQARIAKGAEKKADAARDRAKAQIREASRSDYATAQQRLAEGKWQEAVAYLGRAIRYDPENRNAHDALWLTLRHGMRDVGRLPLQVLAHEGFVVAASFSPDGTRVITASNDKTARIWNASTGEPIGAPLKHDGIVSSASFSPDGTRVVTASWDKTARLWDTNTGLLLGPPLTHKNSVTHASFSPDGTRVVTASWDKTARLWDANTGLPVGAPLTHAQDVTDASFSPDGSRVLTASADSIARLWDASTGLPIDAPFTHASLVASASFSPDGTRVVTASYDQTARVWDANTGLPVAAPLVHTNWVKSASFSPDGTRVVTVSWDKTARVWDANTGLPVTPPLTHAQNVIRASFSPDGSRVLTASGDHTARMWDAKTGLPVGVPFTHAQNVTDANFSPDGSRVITASDDHTARVWDASAGLPVGVPLGPRATFGASFSPDGSRVVTVNALATAFVWDASTGLPIGAPLTHRKGINSASFSPDGSRVVTASDDLTARVWDAKTGLPAGAPLTHSGTVISASFSPDGSRVVTASEDHTARVWDAGTGWPIGAPLTHASVIYNASFSPDSTRVVTASSDSTARVWDAKTGLPVGAPLTHKNQVTGASFSSDGSRVVTASQDRTARVWDANTGRPVGAPLTHAQDVMAASFSPDGTRVVTACFDGTAHMWDANSGLAIGPPLTHSATIRSASFSPDGTRVLTASDDRTAQLWDANTAQPIGVPLTHKNQVTGASFSPDGTRVLTVSGDRTARLWDTGTRQTLTAEIPEMLAAFCSGARLDPELGSLRQLTHVEQMQLWAKLQPALAGAADWRFVAEQIFPQNPRTAPVSQHMSLTLREVSTRLLATFREDLVREAVASDPTHPVLPFAHAVFEAMNFDKLTTNPARAAWLWDYAMKHLPSDAAPADLRLAARYLEKVITRIPGQKANALLLLDRAAKLAPEDDDTTALRGQLK